MKKGEKDTLTFYNYIVQLTHLATIIESSEDAIFSVDLKGKITTWNNGGEKILGYTKEDILEKSAARLFIKGKNVYPRISEKIKKIRS